MQRCLEDQARVWQRAVSKQWDGDFDLKLDVSFACDLHGNHAAQLLVIFATREELSDICARLRGHALKLAKNRFGCRVLSRIVEQHFSHGCCEELLQELVPKLSELATHRFGYHVVKRLLEWGSVLPGLKELLDDCIRDEARQRGFRALVLIRAMELGCLGAEQRLRLQRSPVYEHLQERFARVVKRCESSVGTWTPRQLTLLQQFTPHALYELGAAPRVIYGVSFALCSYVGAVTWRFEARSLLDFSAGSESVHLTVQAACGSFFTVELMRGMPTRQRHDYLVTPVLKCVTMPPTSTLRVGVEGMQVFHDFQQNHLCVLAPMLLGFPADGSDSAELVLQLEFA